MSQQTGIRLNTKGKHQAKTIGQWIYLLAIKKGKRGKAGPLVEVCRPAGNSPGLGRGAVSELALVEEE